MSGRMAGENPRPCVFVCRGRMVLTNRHIYGIIISHDMVRKEGIHMSFEVSNFFNNDDMSVVKQSGPFCVLEYQRDLSVHPGIAQAAYFASQMGVRKRQLGCYLSKAPITLQAGAMQWTVGEVECSTGVKGVGDMFGKLARGAVTKESAIKPEYHGSGLVVTEPTYKHIILAEVSEWDGGLVLDDGLFLACDARLQHRTQARSNLSSAVAGNQGLFNLMLQGRGIVALESDCPETELVKIHLDDDCVKIDGPYAVAWSGSLEFAVERSGKSLIGSAASGEGLVNVYRGTGDVWMMPTKFSPDI